MQQRHADLSQLKALISDLVRTSGLSKHLQGIVLDTDEASVEGNFLRVIIEVDTLDSVSDGDLEAVIASIETAVTEYDSVSQAFDLPKLPNGGLRCRIAYRLGATPAA